MKKLASLLLALALALSLLAVSAMAEDTAAAGVLSYLNKAAMTESHPEYTEEQVEIMSVVADWNDARTVDQEDIPESTIVTDPYFTDAYVTVTLKSSLGQ